MLCGLLFFFLAWAPEGHGQESLTVVINEFGQGRAGTGEWLELVVVGTGPCSTVDMRGWVFRDHQGDAAGGVYLRFLDHPAWRAVPAGTIIVLYNHLDEGNLPLHFPPRPDYDFDDMVVVLPANASGYFEFRRWVGFGNGGDSLILLDAGGRVVDGISYETVAEPRQTPYIGNVGAGRAAWYVGSGVAGVNTRENWFIGYEEPGPGRTLSTPGAGNTPTNSEWIQSLRPRPEASVTPSSHDFGTVPVGGQSAPLVVTVTNTGCAPLTVGTIALAGTNPDQFVIQNDLASGQTIPSGGSRTLEVVFRPTSSGLKSAQLTIPSSAPTATVTLTGTGVLVYYTVQVSAQPPAGGTVGGGGSYAQGTNATVTATPNPCYQFVNWTENGNVVSTAPNYTFTVTSHRNLVANFQLIPYTIRVSAHPALGGTAAGGGTYPCGAEATVVAVANPRYRFVNWTEGGVEVSTSSSYTFTVTADRDLVANFIRLGDVNLDGTVDVRDVRIINQAALGLVALTPLQRLAADVDGDGMITVADAATVAAWLVECP